MRGITIRWLERSVDAGAAALLAAALCYASAAAGAPATVALAVGGVSLLAAFGVLRSVARGAANIGFAFEAQPFPVEADELLLGDCDRLLPPPELSGQSADELVLDDVLAQIGPDARVVRLFDRSAMPAAEQLKAAVDRHLGDDRCPQTAPPDASQDLYQALADLRRSLR